MQIYLTVEQSILQPLFVKSKLGEFYRLYTLSFCEKLWIYVCYLSIYLFIQSGVHWLLSVMENTGLLVGFLLVVGLLAAWLSG